jgi:hypothetical protein
MMGVTKKLRNWFRRDGKTGTDPVQSIAKDKTAQGVSTDKKSVSN